MLFEIIDNEIRFLSYNGGPIGLYQVTAGLYKTTGKHTHMTLGATSKTRSVNWAAPAKYQGTYGIRHLESKGYVDAAV